MTELPYEEWPATRETLHMWTQIIGKIQLQLAAPVNHWWHVAQHVTSRGLSTGPLPHDFVLPWPTMSDGADSDDEAVLTFLQSAWSAAADLGDWNRAEFEAR